MSVIIELWWEQHFRVSKGRQNSYLLNMNNDDDDIFKIDPETAWLETVTIGGFRVWHIIAFCLGIVLSISKFIKEK